MTITNDQLTQWLAENPTASPTDVATAAVAAGVPAAQVAEVLTQTNFFNVAVSTATVNAAYAAVTPPHPPVLELEPPEPPPATIKYSTTGGEMPVQFWLATA